MEAVIEPLLKPGSVTPQNFNAQDPEFKNAILNLINIHVVSELYGADCFEKSILRAPTPEFKMRMAKTCMEEYGHHLRYRRLMDELGIDWYEYAKTKGHLTTFDTPIESWTDQAVFLALVDRSAAHQFRHFINAPYEPFQRAAQETLQEEYGHVGFGMDAVKELLKTPEGRNEVESVLLKWVRIGLETFGASKSHKNDLYRKWGIKQGTNESMRAIYYAQIRGVVNQDWGFNLPEDYQQLMGTVRDEEKVY